MKTRSWLLILGAVLVVCAALSLWLLRPAEDARQVEIWSEGEKLHTLSLETDHTLEVTCQYGKNTITVKDGKIAVTYADCPDQYCVRRGFCSGGTSIICLPHRMEIRFLGEQTIDGAAG